MDKCEWKDKKFEGCMPMTYRIELHGWHASVFSKRIINDDDEYDFCPFCGADITQKDVKPKPIEPLIVKSGKTWVAYWEGVDYLCIKPVPYAIECLEHHGDELITNYPEDWKSFTGPNPDITELTDEIAKLRPIIITNENQDILYGIRENVIILSYGNDNVSDCRLATAKELSDEN